MEQMVFQTSLIAAFIAGIVALFAPCCISFLLPAYLGNVFKEKQKILLMTLIFGLGIFVVMLPAVLGVAALSKALFVYHDDIYTFGGFLMIFVAGMTFFNIKLPMIHLPGRDMQKTDPLSVFILGIFSGITSACCAPVLIGILALTFLSPNFFGAVGIGAVYVLGMVFPLIIISFFLSGKVDKFMLLRKTALEFMLFGKKHSVIWSNFIASIIFLLTGLFILYLKATGKLAMSNLDWFTKTVTGTAQYIGQYTGNFWLNGVFFLVVVILLYYVAKKA